MQIKNKISVNLNEKSSVTTLSNALKPFFIDDTLIVCVGTDKCIGDCLGPLVGTMLKKENFPYEIYGTLANPVHAVNLKDNIKKIKEKHPSSFIIAVDACLGNTNNIGNIEIKHGPVFPGKGVGKVLPSIGNLSVIGVVDSTKSNPNLSLHTIRLGFVMQMAQTIVDAFVMTYQL